MAMQEALRLSIQSREAMGALGGPLRSANMLVQSRAALTVAAIACDAEARAEVRARLTCAPVYLVSPDGWINLKHFQVFGLIRP